jgi:hypothetical protein
MNFEIVALIVAISSFSLLVSLVFKKIPKLKVASEPESIFLKKELKTKIRKRTKEVIKENSNLLELLLHKLLSKIRILFLKAENKLSDWILKLRERSLDRAKEIDSYWNEIRTSIKKKK